MPTNPLWVEHTERAAWDTIEALREQIERERKKNLRLIELQSVLPKLAGVLDEAKREHGLSAEEPLELVVELLAKVRELASQKSALEQERRARELDKAPGPVLVMPEPSSLGTTSSSLRWFSALVAKRAQKSTGRAKLDAERLTRALEHKVDELSGARADELLELAVDIGYLALMLARHARRALRRRAP